MIRSGTWWRPLATLLVAGAALQPLAGCAPLVIGGAMVGSALVAVDRRTTAAQLEDEAIELKAANRVGELATLAHVNATGYNRIVLLTGEAPTAADSARIEDAVRRIDNVRSVVNELAVMAPSSLGGRSNDAVITGKVKASFVDTRDLQASAIKIVTERGIVYLMGLVTEREAQRAAQVARAVPGVVKVVRVFELISEAELQRLQPPPSPPSTPQ